MNILLLTTHLNIGGISSYLLTLAKGLKKRGHNVYIASSQGELLDKFNKEGITFISIPIKTKAEINPKILISALKLLDIIKKENIDIIHAHTRVTQVLACLLKKIAHKPFVSTCHGFFKKRLFRRLLPCWGTKIIAISEQVKEHLVRDFGVEPDNIRIVHNGIDVERFRLKTPDYRLQTKRGLGLGDGPVVGIVARLSDVKGHIYLIQAMRRVLEDIPKAQLLIVGSGKMQNELINLTKNLRIQEKVKFIPSVAETKDVLLAMDIFVMPSLKEGLGLALMEAMAVGLAVVGSSVGGIKTLIQDEYNGLLVEPANVDALRDAILELLQQPQKRTFLGNNARLFIQQNFSDGNMAEDTERVYLECLNAKY